MARRPFQRRSGRLVNRCASIALVALTSAACGQERTRVPAPRAEIRDSAGIRIVENPRPPEGSRLAWRIGPEPLVSIGVLEGEEAYMLYGALDATRLSDGRIVVANRGTNELRVFDESGTHVDSWAGEGEGPGEFTSLSRVEPWPGDSIAAWWTRTGGISVFDSDGNYGRTFRLGGNTSRLREPIGSTCGSRFSAGDSSMLPGAIWSSSAARTATSSERSGRTGRWRGSCGASTCADPPNDPISRPGSRSRSPWFPWSGLRRRSNGIRRMSVVGTGPRRWPSTCRLSTP